MVCVADVLLPQSSVAVNVRTTILTAASPAIVSLATSMLTSPQLRKLKPRRGPSRHCTQKCNRQECSNSGAVVSWTVIVCVALLLLPASSVAVNVRVIVYSPAQAPAVVSFTTSM